MKQPCCPSPLKGDNTILALFFALIFAYLLVNVDIRLIRGTACGVPAQELHVFENLFD